MTDEVDAPGQVSPTVYCHAYLQGILFCLGLKPLQLFLEFLHVVKRMAFTGGGGGLERQTQSNSFLAVPDPHQSLLLQETVSLLLFLGHALLQLLHLLLDLGLLFLI